MSYTVELEERIERLKQQWLSADSKNRSVKENGLEMSYGLGPNLNRCWAMSLTLVAASAIGRNEMFEMKQFRLNPDVAMTVVLYAETSNSLKVCAIPNELFVRMSKTLETMRDLQEMKLNFLMEDGDEMKYREIVSNSVSTLHSISNLYELDLGESLKSFSELQRIVENGVGFTEINSEEASEYIGDAWSRYVEADSSRMNFILMKEILIDFDSKFVERLI